MFNKSILIILGLFLNQNASYSADSTIRPRYLNIWGTIWAPKAELDQALLFYSGKINSKDTSGFTALHRAIMFERVDAVAALIAHRADIYLLDSKDTSSIDLAKSKAGWNASVANQKIWNMLKHADQANQEPSDTWCNCFSRLFRKQKLGIKDE